MRPAKATEMRRAKATEMQWAKGQGRTRVKGESPGAMAVKGECRESPGAMAVGKAWSYGSGKALVLWQ